MEKENKKAISIKLKPETIDKINKMSEDTGLKKNTIIEQGIERRLLEYDKTGK
jgi:predicted DNA-binding protein